MVEFPGAGLTPGIIAAAASFIAEQNQDFGIAFYGYGKWRETSIWYIIETSALIELVRLSFLFHFSPSPFVY